MGDVFSTVGLLEALTKDIVETEIRIKETEERAMRISDSVLSTRRELEIARKELDRPFLQEMSKPESPDDIEAKLPELWGDRDELRRVIQARKQDPNGSQDLEVLRQSLFAKEDEIRFLSSLVRGLRQLGPPAPPNLDVVGYRLGFHYATKVPKLQSDYQHLKKQHLAAIEDLEDLRFHLGALHEERASLENLYDNQILLFNRLKLPFTILSIEGHGPALAAELAHWLSQNFDPTSYAEALSYYRRRVEAFKVRRLQFERFLDEMGLNASATKARLEPIFPEPLKGRALEMFLVHCTNRIPDALKALVIQTQNSMQETETNT